MSFKGKTLLLRNYITTHFSKEDQNDIHRQAQELSAEVELRQIREANHMTQKQPEASVGASQSAVSRIVAETASGMRIQPPIA